MAVYDNYFRLIIDLYFYEKFSTPNFETEPSHFNPVLH